MQCLSKLNNAEKNTLSLAVKKLKSTVWLLNNDREDELLKSVVHIFLVMNNAQNIFLKYFTGKCCLRIQII